MRRAIVWTGAAAAIVGGTGWIVKGVWIVLTGSQPPVVFEAGPPLFLVALWGLGTALEWPGRPGRWAKGLVLAAAIAMLALGVLALVVPQWVPESDELTPIGALFFVSFLLTLGGLFALGLVVRRTRAFPGPWRTLPVAMAVAVLPLMVVSGLVADAFGNERLIEPMIVLFGAAWTLLGVFMWRTFPGTRPSARPAASNPRRRQGTQDATGGTRP